MTSISGSFSCARSAGVRTSVSNIKRDPMPHQKRPKQKENRPSLLCIPEQCAAKGHSAHNGDFGVHTVAPNSIRPVLDRQTPCQKRPTLVSKETCARQTDRHCVRPVNVCVCVCVCVFSCVRYACISRHAYVYTHANTCNCRHVYMYAYTCIHTCI